MNESNTSFREETFVKLQHFYTKSHDFIRQAQESGCVGESSHFVRN